MIFNVYINRGSRIDSFLKIGKTQRETDRQTEKNKKDTNKEWRKEREKERKKERKKERTVGIVNRGWQTSIGRMTEGFMNVYAHRKPLILQSSLYNPLCMEELKKM